MTLALCLPRADSCLWHDRSISDMDDAHEESFASEMILQPNMTQLKKYKVGDPHARCTLKDLVSGPCLKRQKLDVSAMSRMLVRDSPRSPDILHHACCKSTVTLLEIEAIIKSDPLAPTRAANVQSEKLVYDYATASRRVKTVKETYSYPLNMAIQNNAPRDVIEFLIEAGPSVLNLNDGQQRENSLMVLLKHAPDNKTLIDKILFSSPQSALSRDQRNNTCLHIACRSNAPLLVIRHLAIIHPEALSTTNFWQQTPLSITQASSAMSSDDVSIYLWERQSHSEESR